MGRGSWNRRALPEPRSALRAKARASKAPANFAHNHIDAQPGTRINVVLRRRVFIMAEAQRTSQQKIIELKRGLFVLRYASTENDAFPPKVTIAPEARSIDNVQFVLHPDREEAVLWRPGTALVVQAAGPAKLQVEVKATDANGFSSATVRLEELSQGEPARELEFHGDWDVWDQAAAAPTPGAKPEGLRIIGHVAGIGDVPVKANEWIAGPNAPSRIEGLALEWPNKPAGLSVRYAIKPARANAGSSTPVELGQFAGSRGRAMQLVGAMFELSGPDAARYELTTEAVFLGSPVMRANGQRVVLKGPTGREPLVGLRVDVHQLDSAANDFDSVEAAKPAGAPKAPGGRVRVFRSPAAKRG